MANFKITYKALDAQFNVIKEGQVIAKNKMSEFDALAGFENHLKSKLPTFYQLQCVNIEVETMLGFMPTGSGLSKSYVDIFKEVLGMKKA